MRPRARSAPPPAAPAGDGPVSPRAGGDWQEADQSDKITAVTDSDSPLAALARQHLPPDVADTWLRLVRPALWLRASRDGETVVGRLGGNPALPADLDWPTWERHGSLSFIAEVNCGELPSRHLDVELPERGTLLFFYFEGQNGDDFFWGPGTEEGARVIYVPEGVAVAERSTPGEIDPHPRVTLATELTETWPTWEHPAVLAAFGALDAGDMTLALLNHPINDDDFCAGLSRHSPRPPRHQVGGYAEPVQRPVEWEAAEAVVSGDSHTPGFREEMTRWVLLAQIDSDGDAQMDWGDTGALYWMIRPEDLAARRFDRAAFTLQCS